MKNIFSKLVLAAFLISAISGTAYARECTACKQTTMKKSAAQSKAAVCKRAQSTSELNVNNVRALINGYGNMWYDGSIAKYNIPRDGTSTPLYCAALWIGGTDVNEQLRLAALSFGQYGDDYWPGPLTVDGKADITVAVCNYYDRHYKITQTEVQNFMQMFDYDANGATPNSNYDEGAVPDIIKNWPAHGNFDNQSFYLAPFKDVNGDGEYHYQDGDYPYYDFNNDLCPRTLKAALAPGENYVPVPTMEDSAGIVHGGLLSDQVLKGDQTIWWVFNDMGNTHTESGGQPIGMEIRAQAFAFSTNDEINNMTFYSYEIINRSTYELRNTYFSQWVDPDLGYASDDFVGCDVKRGLGYCYNGKDNDGPGTGAYSGVPPAVGIDFFQGPYMDPDQKDNPKIDLNKMDLYYPGALANYALPTGGYDIIRLTDDAESYVNAWYFEPNDSIGNCAINGVNFGNGIVDDERFGMRRFVYYNNSSTGYNSDPRKATDYYNFLRGYWKNSQRMTFGGDGISSGTTDVPCDFMFPGDSDPWMWGTNGVDPALGHEWTEPNEGNSPGDRRFMQSAGPFTLKPGALNYITVGIPFAQAASGNAWSSVEMLREIDDVCQALFENCFKVLDGPDAPTLSYRALKNEIILYLSYENPASNNFGESYSEVDPAIVRSYTENGVTHIYSDDQRSYKFEGYQIYQLHDGNCSVTDIGDVTKARLVAQCDIENYYDEGQTVPIGTLVNYTTNSATGLITGQVMVTGANKGIQHVFRVTTDQFATGVSTALVNNKEYYYVAIAYAHNRFKEYSQTEADKLDGQKEPYLAGRKNEKGGTITAIKAIPHDPSSENGGTIIQADFGMSPVITRIEGYGNGGYALSLTQESIEELMGKPGEYGKGPGTLRENVSTTYSGNMDNPCIIPHPKYEENAGPVDVRIIDPMNVKGGQYYIQFTGVDDTSKWVISKVDGTPLYDDVLTDTADFIISRYNEQLFLDLGLAVSITNPTTVATELTVVNNNGSIQDHGGLVNQSGVISSSMTYADPAQRWLSYIPESDNAQLLNWVRSGSQYTEGNIAKFIVDNADNPISMAEPYLDEDYYKNERDNAGRTTSYALDKYEVFEDVVGGAWAPYGVVSTLPYHPGFNFSYYVADSTVLDSVRAKNPSAGIRSYFETYRRMMNNITNKSLRLNDMSKLPSVIIVFTADTTKWTRCPVLEMCDDYTQSEGHARRFSMRKHLSVDKCGRTIDDLGIAADPNNPNNPAYINAEGMGWFPGYAICLETGERLNVMFGEDSRYIQYNGRDMMWNPVSDLMSGTANYVMGGRHYVYVMNSVSQRFPRYHASSATVAEYRSPSYDAGRWAVKMLGSLDRLINGSVTAEINRGLLYSEGAKPINNRRDSAAFFFSTVAWVNLPLVNSRYAFNNPLDIPCDVTVKINVNRTYGKFYSNNGTLPTAAGYEVTNDNNPLYMFELTDDVVTLTGQATAENASRSYQDSLLAMIGVVPNPYYSYSKYETQSQLETKIRFVNVPANSTISIYTVDGTLVRRLGPTPSNTTTVDWDLLNHNGLPIAGGMYLVHFNCPGIGERVVKWFGTMRPVDLQSFKF